MTDDVENANARTHRGVSYNDCPPIGSFPPAPPDVLMTLSLSRFILICAGVLLACDSLPAQTDSLDTTPRWWKGNIHTHSLWSDGNDFPEMIADWYRTHDYNFLALSDHNVLSEGQRWMPHREIVRRGGGNALKEYKETFGDGWVETRGPADSDMFQVRLKPLNEFRALVEERGKFIMIQGEEISDRSQGVPVHMNASNLKTIIQPLGGPTVREAMTNNLRALEDQAKRTGREMMLHLNHPNFGLAITAEDLAAVLGEQFFEVYNGHPSVKQEGDANHPSVERLWDIANTLRIDQWRAAPLFGVATDDSHNYHSSSGSTSGRGWVMVRAQYLTPEHLIRAMKQGDFYASSGVSLESVEYDREKRKLRVVIAGKQGIEYTTQFIGTRANYDKTTSDPTGEDGKPLRATKIYSDDVGEVLATTTGPVAEYTLTGEELYVRAVVTSSEDHDNPSMKDQKKQAWTQPFGWRERLKPQD